MEITAPRVRTLVVDDDPSVCALLGEMLSAEGFACESCSGGTQALDLLEQHSFDAIISDLQMPGMSGLVLLEQCRKKYPRAAFLMITGVDDVRMAIQAMREGAADYLVKPFQLDAVLCALERAVERKRLELELEEHRRRLEEMVKQRSTQLESTMSQIEETYDDTLEALGAALDLRDAETAGHSRRVSRYCLEMANLMGWTAEQLKHLARGAYLHDIGKIGIADSVLLKEGRLTAEERIVMQAHVRIGYELVSRIPFLAPAAEIVLTHHERYDGKGYPQGLMGEQIPLASRIFAVADTLDAMTSDRPYRRALPFSAAWEETNRESGWQFDPNIVQVFRSIPEQGWENIRSEIANLGGWVTRTPTSQDRPAWIRTSASETWPKRTKAWAKDNDRRRSPKAGN